MIREIVIDHPPLNILTGEVMRRLTHDLLDLGDARAVLIRGEGKCFSAGADVLEHLPENAEAMLAALHRLIMTIMELPVPSVAAVHGGAIGGGLELAMACDLIYAAESATLQQPEIKLGCIAPFAAEQLPAAVGTRRALDILLTGRPVPAPEAHAMGLVSAVFPVEGFLDRVRDRARGIAAFSRPALSACRRAVLHDWDARFRRAEEIYIERVVPADDYREGLTAFLEKREPKWSHR